MPTTTATPILLQLVSVIFLIGAIRGGILLLKDSMKHKRFAKVIRIIAGAIQLLSIAGSIFVISIAYINAQLLTSLQSLTSRNGLSITIMIIGGISIISYITSIRGGILLFIESGKNTSFKKWIRIITGIIMILSLFLSFLSL